MNRQMINKGYTLIETLIAIFIAGVIIMFVGNSFFTLIKSQALDKDYLSVSSFIDQAKSMSINSKAASQYGVYFASSTVILFKGQNYISTSTDNRIYNLNNQVNISNINLVGSSTNQITFDRLTGYANASGTISLSLKTDAANSKIIRVYKTGLIEYK